MKMITATHINYYHICRRKLWLFSNGIQMEHTSGHVAEGKLIGETSYPDRAAKYTEIEVDGVKIDYYDPGNKVVHEVKKSNKMQEAHVAQVKYYIWKLAQKGIEGVTGIIEYPRQKQRHKVTLGQEDGELIKKWEKEVAQIMTLETCPPVIHAKICQTCSYYDLCYAGEE